MIPVIQLVSYPGSGAPESFDRIVAELAAGDVRIGVVEMNAPDSSYRPGRDVPASPGAVVNVMVEKDRLIAIEQHKAAPSLDQVHLRFFGNVDVVLHRGFAGSALPEIAFFNPDSESNDLPGRDHLFATVGFEPGFRSDLPCFEADDPGALADFIFKTFHIRRRKERREDARASLLVNGKAVGMQKFVENLIVSVMGGVVKSLKHTDDAREVELYFRFPEDE